VSILELLKANSPLLIVGLLSTLAYLARFLYLHGSDEAEKATGNAIIIFPAGASIVGGIKVVILSFDPKICNTSEVEQLYVCLGGLAILIASCFDVYRKIKNA
jgi:hypothetical protein